MNRKMLGYPAGEELFRSRRTVVYRSRDPATDRPVVLKVMRQVRPTRSALRWFRREYDLLVDLADIDGVIGAIDHGREGDQWLMVIEDIGGQALASLIQSRALRVSEFLPLAVRLAATLARVHAAGVVHRDINPSNIVVNRGTGQVRLIDFGIATRLPRTLSPFQSPGAILGTLSHISPEQTGRMNRSVDHRTDLYSLGATFYQALSGRLPFDDQDPSALIHAHIARVPVPLHERQDHIPQVLSDIVARLMAKAPEDRYQTAEALRVDLQECLRQERETGEVRPFVLERHAPPGRLLLPEQLYGRDAELASLLAALDRVASGYAECVLVAGPAGVGKSALVHELFRPITRRGGFFISGKFDQLHRDVPLAVVIQALRDLTRQVLSEPADRLETWRVALLDALGPNGQVLLDVIPDLEAVIGPQPPAVQVSSGDQRVRLMLVFGHVLRVFAQAEHPLTIFLDDLQWVDPASLQLLESLLEGDGVEHLLIIGAYRDNEVAPGHPLMLAASRLALRAAEGSGAGVWTISLGPLGAEHVAEFLADMTRRPPEDVAPLAQVLVEKTAGNPFFVRELVKQLYADGRIRLDEGQWSWDHQQVRSLGITDNVVELVTGRLATLPPQTRETLYIAGLLGSRFDLETLAVATARSVADTWMALWPAVLEGFLVVLGDAWKLVGEQLGEDDGQVPVVFAHDRVQQATLALQDPAGAARTSWQVGERLDQRWPAAQDDGRLFEIVAHKNAGHVVITDQAERDRLAALNLRAAKKARASAAFDAAYAHASTALELLGPDGPDRHGDLVMELLSECVESAYQTGDHAGMDRHAARAVSLARDVLETAWIHEIQTEAFNARGRPLDALGHALDYLAQLGIDFPREPGHDDVVAELGAAAALLAGRSLDQLQHAPDIDDPRVRVAVGLICKIYSSAYVASPYLFAVVTLRQFQLVVQHGNCPVSPLVYAVYGLLMAALANDVDAAYAFGSLSDRMLHRPDVKRFEAQARHLFSCHTRMWKEHLKVCADGERKAFEVGQETGEMEFGCYGGHVATKYAVFHGQNLDALLPEAEQYTVAMQRYKQDLPLNSHLPWHQFIENLVDTPDQPHMLVGPVLDASKARARLEQSNDRMAISNTITAQLMLAVIFGRFTEAVELGTVGNTFLDAVLSQFNQPVHMFFDAVARLERCHHAPQDARASLRETARNSLDALAAWAPSVPQNLEQKVTLLTAMFKELDGDPREARETFDDAVAQAHAHGFLLDEAIANEASARFHMRQGRAAAARHHLADARDCYVRWGARSKVLAMETEHAALLPSPVPTPRLSATRGTSQTTIQPGPDSLDLGALLRAAEAISSEVVLARLLHRLVTVVMETAGAVRTVLLLRTEGQTRVEAEGFSDGRIEVLQGHAAATEEQRARWLPPSVYNVATRTGEPVLVDDAGRHARFGTDPYVLARGTRSMLCVPIKRQGQQLGALFVENDLVAGAFTTQRARMLTLLAGQMAVSIENARLYEDLELRVARRTRQLEARNDFIRGVFGRYMSDEVVDTLLDSRDALKLGGERRTLTLMFSDLRGFTAMCERLSPEQALRTINNYFAVMTAIIQRHGGSINNIIGDGMLVLFGAPIWRDDNADRAVACALEMQRAMPEVNRNNAAEGLPALSMGIGIHTGEVVVGNVGSEQRARYSAIGRHVNLASRVEAATTGGDVLVSEATRSAMSKAPIMDGDLRIHPKGVDAPITVSRVVGLEGRDDLRLPQRDHQRVALESPRGVAVHTVDGKNVSTTSVHAQLLSVGPRSVSFSLAAPVGVGRDLALGTDDGMVYVRVVSEDGDVVAAITSGDPQRLV